MNKIRKFLVQQFVLATYIKLFGKTFTFLRASRILFPMFAFIGMIIVTYPSYPLLQWWDFALLGILLIAVWIGFGFWNWGYFRLFPFEYDELDDEQKQNYLDGISQGKLKNPEQDYKFGFLVGWQIPAFDKLTKMMKEKYSVSFAGLSNLLPLAITLVSILIWYHFIFPFFNK